ncbi:DNA-directed RNA polymerase subunit delta [Vagococcus xieshaowenii]|uniref:Probable DNA-directed RNA polymerase subunit delta n=1 Tax=Vagococcus xieshaowenii TaxID=2562451 RepID=A0A4Z0D7U8_9ENTE|nr:DNA-directed RNA polymerase subunit delta [Vagococcus xieshaowenii]QCA29082.1 DNA-directed RNA polymerase subunit delta [Vagococcus xieshaowenii]TFZ40942.1 DNA-directed RNA polymerase subunit delta [Vagococcus xieshaowenii]
MEIKAFDGVNKEELSMIEVAHAILEERGEIIDFSDLVNQIQNYLGKSDSVIREELSQFYTDLNIDGSFISLGENRWGLRSWYPIDSIDEEVSNYQDEDEDDRPVRKKRKRVNAFIDSDEDAIDYNDDDPEDSDLSVDDDDYIDEDEDDEEIAEYNKDLSELGADDIDDEDDIPEGVEDELTIVHEDDLDSDLDYEDEEDEEEL